HSAPPLREGPPTAAAFSPLPVTSHHPSPPDNPGTVPHEPTPRSTARMPSVPSHAITTPATPRTTPDRRTPSQVRTPTATPSDPASRSTEHRGTDAGRGFTERGFTERGFTERGFTGRRFTKRGFTGRRVAVPALAALLLFPLAACGDGGQDGAGGGKPELTVLA